MTADDFVFLSCLRSPASTDAYARAEAMFEACARAALGQRSAAARMIAVGHREPAFAARMPGLDFHVIELGVPAAGSPHDDAINLDKGIKRLVALGHALRQGARYVAMLDADDLVGRDLVSRIRAGDEGGAAVSRFLSDGYLLDHANATVMRKHGLQRHCGSTIVYAADALRGVFRLDGVLEPRPLFEANRDRARLIVDLLGNHQRPVGWLVSQGHPVRRHRGRDVAWVINNGANVVGHFASPSGRIIDARIRGKFGLDAPASGRSRDTLSARAAESLRAVGSLVGARRFERDVMRHGDPGPPSAASRRLELPEC